MVICSKCEKKFKSNKTFDNHPCCQAETGNPDQVRKERLERLLASGGCGQAYYDKAMSEINK